MQCCVILHYVILYYAVLCYGKCEICYMPYNSVDSTLVWYSVRSTFLYLTATYHTQISHSYTYSLMTPFLFQPPPLPR